MNNQRFKLSKARAVSGYHDAGAFFEGDFNREFVIEDNIGFAGQGVDMAHSENGVYRNNTFTGQSSDAANIGLKCFSHINDGPLAGLGTTGVTNARNVTVEGNRCDKFISGIVLQNGTHWKIRDNYLTNINGKDSSPGTGVLINYINGGSFSTVGNPVWNVSISGNHIDGIGNVIAGCGVNIGANAITNSDAINRIIIDGNMMSGASGSRGVCADTTSTAKIANVFVGINEYSNVGGLFDANMPTHAKPSALPR
jgi:hypothetical protein